MAEAPGWGGLRAAPDTWVSLKSCQQSPLREPVLPVLLTLGWQREGASPPGEQGKGAQGDRAWPPRKPLQATKHRNHVTLAKSLRGEQWEAEKVLQKSILHLSLQHQ